MDLGLKDRVYIVTGGTRGLGRAAARELVADGARVVVSGRGEKSVAAAEAELGGRGQAVGVVADNADPVAPDRLIGAARDAFNRLDGVLISVGGRRQVRRTPSTTTCGAPPSSRSSSVRCGCPAPSRRSWTGRGHRLRPLQLRVRADSRSRALQRLPAGPGRLREEPGERAGPRGIRVVGLVPAHIETDRVRELDAHTGHADAARARATAGVPLRRYGTPEEFGRSAAFLLSPAASYLTGVMLSVDGGVRRSF